MQKQPQTGKQKGTLKNKETLILILLILIARNNEFNKQ